MPNATPLTVVLADLRARGTSNLDARCALHAPHAIAHRQGAGLVVAWGRSRIVHAVEAEPFGPTSQLLLDLLPTLPDRLELRAGTAAAGILAETHTIELVAPVRRLALATRATPSSPVSVPLTPDDAAAVRAIADEDAPMPPSPLPAGWRGVRRGTSLVAAAGPVAMGDGAALIAAPRLARGARRDETATRLLADVAAAFDAELALDVRADRKDRREQAYAAGFVDATAYERWWCVRRFGATITHRSRSPEDRDGST